MLTRAAGSTAFTAAGVLTALTAVSLAGTAAAALMYRGKAPGGLVVFVAGTSLALGAWAVLGWIWHLSGGVVG